MSPSRHSPWPVCLLLWLPLLAGAAVHHSLEVGLDPDGNAIAVTDTLTLPGGLPPALEFTLHPGLAPESLDAGVELTAIAADAGGGQPAPEDADLRPQRYRVDLPAGLTRLRLRYHGRIAHALQQSGSETARGFRETPGTITAQGVFLAGRSFWYPHLAGQLMTFDLSLRLPPGWYGMTQGTRAAHETVALQAHEQWHCRSPQQEIYLVAGPFTEYTQQAGGVQAMVLLREPDATLAQPYLDATGDYLGLYSDLIGSYPYGKFALVENFWETGYGMPSFTLLGPKVIRFPFILHSSYPHEILHNWWGNGVYVDYDHGNWSEGLTSYLADHLVKEQRGEAEEYRRATLQKYTDYVRDRQDFALTAFRSRHGAVTEAVGYGKTLMLFHMLRRRLGDADFIRGLRTFYSANRFRVAGFGAVEAAFGEVAAQPLDAFFTQWVERTGAPQLAVVRAQARPQSGGFVLSAVIEQVQEAAPYVLQVPLAIRLQGREQAWQSTVRLDRKRTTLELALPARPLQLDVDPQFDVFRRLDPREVPPAISQALGAEEVLIVLPAAAPAALALAYESLARAWQAARPGQSEVVMDSDLEQLPGDRAVWLFGWHNRFRPQLASALADHDYTDRGDTLHIDGTTLHPDEQSVVVMGRRPTRAGQTLGWLAAGQAAALPGLGRKLPHYGKYSYLAFTGEAPDNSLKGQWPVVHSPLSVPVVQADGVPVVAPGPARLAPRAPLAPAPVTFSAVRMQRDIAFLADAALEGRGLGTPGLARAAGYIADRMRAAGLRPGASDGSTWLQTWQAPLPDTGRIVTLQNVIGVLPGSDPGRAGESLVIGAHYDHLGRGGSATRAADRGQVHPGADDNASGVAVLLELARVLAGKPLPRRLVFVAFTGEESGRLGSRHFLGDAASYPPAGMTAMVNLDTVGRLDGRPLLALGAGSAREWEHILRGTGYVTGVPVTPVADDIGSSDQTSFIEAGVPAVQLFSGAHADFHRPGDTPDKIDAEGLVKTAQVLKEVVTYLAGRAEALNAGTGGGATRNGAAPPVPGQRRVGLGIVPDYAASADGVRVGGVGAQTPAAAAGLRPGDLVTALNDTPVRNLRDYAQALKELAPGDAVQIVFRRGTDEHRVTARAVER